MSDTQYLQPIGPGLTSPLVSQTISRRNAAAGFGNSATNPASNLTNLTQSWLTPNLPPWLIPIFGSLIVLVMVNAWDKIFYVPVVIGLVGIIFLWLTQPNQ